MKKCLVIILLLVISLLAIFHLAWLISGFHLYSRLGQPPERPVRLLRIDPRFGPYIETASGNIYHKKVTLTARAKFTTPWELVLPKDLPAQDYKSYTNPVAAKMPFWIVRDAIDRESYGVYAYVILIDGTVLGCYESGDDNAPAMIAMLRLLIAGIYGLIGTVLIGISVLLMFGGSIFVFSLSSSRSHQS